MSENPEKQAPTDAALEARIVKALKELKAEGKTESLRNIRGKLGVSPNLLTEPVRRLKAQLAEQERERAAMPPLPESLQPLLIEIWEAAWKAADQTADNERSGYQARLNALRAEIEAYEEDLAEEAARVESLTDEVTKLKNENGALIVQLSEAKMEAEELREKLRDKTARLAERDDLVELVKQLQVEGCQERSVEPASPVEGFPEIPLSKGDPPKPS
ncbi:DNA-binding protein [Thioclava sp. 'Guangxiensis']|uniref:DNA-binding protein n=1 Tax=Thioclava sp. 'Guangxiensis' TaxID=3149044 RepID=UPI0038780130